MTRHPRQRGFTLVEMLVVVTVLGILSAVAIPSWRESMAKGHRSQARQALILASQWLETQYAIRNTYCASGGCGTSPLPTAMQFTPAAGRRAYDIQVVNLSDNAFELRAVPTSPGPVAGDTCGTLKIDNVGRRSQTGTPANAALCWPR